MAINNQPEITLPSNRITYEDTELEITGISISDQDIADGNMEVELSVDSGFITLGSLSGLTFSSPADADGVEDQSLTFLGTLTDITNALNPIIFTPQDDFNGDVQLYVKVNDLGGTGSGGPLQDDNFLFITVNAVNDIPSAVNDIGSVDEDTILIANVLDNDFDLDSTNGSSPDSHYSLSIDINPVTNVQNGVLVLTNDGTYTYTPYSNFNGIDSFVYTLFDGAGGESQGMVDITVNGVNDPPILNVPNDKSTNEDTQITINGFSIEDIDIDVNDMRMDIYVENSFISLSSTNGLVFINGNSETGSGSQLTFTGNKTNIVEAVNDMIFTPDENYNGEVIVDITISDLGGSGSGNAESDSESFVVTVESVNDPPVISYTELTNYNEDIEFSIYGVSISDIDAIESSDEVQVTLSVQNGKLSLVPNSFSTFNFLEGSGILDSEMTFVGSISDINVALNGFSFLGNENYNGEDFISVEVSDLGNSGAGDILIDQAIMSFNLEPINDPPVNQTPVGIDSPPTLNVDGVMITASPGIWNDKIDTDISSTSEKHYF